MTKFTFRLLELLLKYLGSPPQSGSTTGLYINICTPPQLKTYEQQLHRTGTSCSHTSNIRIGAGWPSGFGEQNPGPNSIKCPSKCIPDLAPTYFLLLRDGPLENLWGGGRTNYKKKIWRFVTKNN